MAINETNYDNYEEQQEQLLFRCWQTEPWSPKYVGPDDIIPVNDFQNVELALLNPGLVHIDQPRVAQVAKKLGL